MRFTIGIEKPPCKSVDLGIGGVIPKRAFPLLRNVRVLCVLFLRPCNHKIHQRVDAFSQ
jgi:hypothetical protein